MFDPSKIKIVFFDIGNVFVSDDPSGCYIYRQLYERLKDEDRHPTVEEFFRLRTEHFREGGSLWKFVGRYVQEAEFKDWQVSVRRQMYSQWGKLSPAVTSMAEVPARLAPYYRLGIIANQPGEVEDLLRERCILDFFEIRAISDVLNLHKPNPAFYQWALDAAGVKPEEALMVGDRIDNDVRPAKSLGMKTAWLRLGSDGREWKPADEFETHYAESNNLSNRSDMEPVAPEDQPDLTVYSAAELVASLVPASMNS